MHNCRLVPSLLSLAILLGGSVACGPAPDRPDIARIEDARLVDSEPLRAAAASGSTEQRARALLAMGRIQHAGYTADLARACADESREVRTAALFALGQLGLARGAEPTEVAREAARTARTDADPGIRAAAVEALGKLADPDAEDDLREALADPAEGVRAEAAHALFRLRFVPTWRGQSDEPPELTEASVQALIHSLGDDSVDVRRMTAHAFSRYAQAEAADALADRLADDDEWVRLFAVRALGRTADAGMAERLVAGLGDSSARVRTEIVLALGRLEADLAVPEALDGDPSFHVRAATTALLAQAADRASSARLEKLLEDETATVKAAALAALAGSRKQAVLPFAEAALGDSRWPVRVAAVRALAAVGEQAQPLLGRAAEDPAPAVRLAAFESRVAVDPRIETLEPGLSSEDLALRGTALALLDELELPEKTSRLESVYAESAGEEWVEIRESIVDLLADRDDAAGTLRRIFETDEAGSVRDRARQALGRQGQEMPTDVATLPVDPSPLLGRSFSSDPIVELETTKGTIEIRCQPESAPIHVASFVDLVRSGHYDGLYWHRVVPNFVIQGGDPRGDGWGGAGYLMRDEIGRERYRRGSVGMPKAGKDTGGGQIFIAHLPTPHLDGNYTLFGQVTSGLEVIDRIEVGDQIVRATVRGD